VTAAAREKAPASLYIIGVLYLVAGMVASLGGFVFAMLTGALVQLWKTEPPPVPPEAAELVESTMAVVRHFPTLFGLCGLAGILVAIGAVLLMMRLKLGWIALQILSWLGAAVIAALVIWWLAVGPRLIELIPADNADAALGKRVLSSWSTIGAVSVSVVYLLPAVLLALVLRTQAIRGACDR
jgi:hypothetical protein